jgi:hypothetical protein
MRARRPSRTRLGYRDAYCLADIIGAVVSNFFISPEITIQRISDLLQSHWNEGVFTAAEIDEFARYGAADLDEQRQFMTAFTQQLSVEEWNDLLNRWYATSYTVAERQEIQEQAERWYQGARS